VTSGFSNPSWFPTPPPRPLKPISTPKVILGTVVPFAAIAVVVVLIMTQKPARSTAATGRSIAAFNACLRAKVEASPGQAPSPTALQQDAEACGNHLPAGTRVPDFTRSQRPSNSEQQAYDQCMQAALGNGQQGAGRGGGFNRQAVENASAICRALILGGGSSTPTTPVTTASGSPTA
jgi:hypothetical protein